MTPVKGEPLGVICNWPPALEAALQRWGTTQAKCPCLTALDVTGKPVYTLTYGEWCISAATSLLQHWGVTEHELASGNKTGQVFAPNTWGMRGL